MPNHNPNNSNNPSLPVLEVIDLGSISYQNAYILQKKYHKELLSKNNYLPHENNDDNISPSPVSMKLLLLEHNPPVITVTKKKGASQHITTPPALLAKQGIELHETDRGGDVTYHGPGQLVGYAILDLKQLGIGVRQYMELLEQIIINSLAHWHIKGERDPAATGVWVAPEENENRQNINNPIIIQSAKICAMGVRVSRWITMHGFALNVTTNLSHFQNIIPCGLAGRPVTSIEKIIKNRNSAEKTPVEKATIPDMAEVKQVVAREFNRSINSIQNK